MAYRGKSLFPKIVAKSVPMRSAAELQKYRNRKRRFLAEGGGRGNPFASLMNTLQSGASQLIAHPLDYGSMFIDRAGTTPVTAPGQQVGRVLDVGGGNFHATAVSDAARGFFAVVPETGRRNTVTGSELLQSNGGAWSAGTAFTRYETAHNKQYLVLSRTSETNSNASFQRAPIRDGEFSFSWFWKPQSQNQTISFFRSAATMAPVTATIAADGSFSASVGSERVSTEVFPTGEVRVSVHTSVSGGAGGQNYRWEVNLVLDQETWLTGAQIEENTSVATPYQRVGSQFDVTEAGVRSLSYLDYNGVNTAYQTPVLPAPGVDKAQVFSGFRRATPSTQIIYELSPTIDSNNGALRLTGTSAESYSFGSRGTTQQSAITPVYSTPVTLVHTSTADISAPFARYRINEVEVAQITASQGTGNYNPSGTYPLYYGARGGTSLFFNGHHYGTLGPITRFGTNATADQIAAAEAYYTKETGL